MVAAAWLAMLKVKVAMQVYATPYFKLLFEMCVCVCGGGGVCASAKRQPL
jgi:hypothetical protein